MGSNRAVLRFEARPKVTNLGGPVATKEDVLPLEIEMNHFLFVMKMCEASGHILHEGQHQQFGIALTDLSVQNGFLDAFADLVTPPSGASSMAIPN